MSHQESQVSDTFEVKKKKEKKTSGNPECQDKPEGGIAISGMEKKKNNFKFTDLLGLPIDKCSLIVHQSPWMDLLQTNALFTQLYTGTPGSSPVQALLFSAH